MHLLDATQQGLDPDYIGHDVLSLAGPNVEERRELFDFIVALLTPREHPAPHRIRPLRVFLHTSRVEQVGKTPKELLSFQRLALAGVTQKKVETEPRRQWSPDLNHAHEFTGQGSLVFLGAVSMPVD